MVINRLIACPFLFSVASLLSPVIIDSAAKGLLLLLVTATGILALRGASASWRHFIWVSAMAGLFLLPVMSFVLPSWRVLPSWFDDSVAAVSDASAARAPVVVETEAIELTHRAAAPPVTQEAEPYVDIAPAKAGFTTETSEATQGDEVIGVPLFGEGIAALVAAIWVAGGAILLTRLVLSGLVLSYVASKSKRLTCGKVHDEFQILRKRLGIRRDVQILQSDRRTVPMTWGVLKARVSLPSDSDSWGDERLRAVLLHELAHVKRCDSLMHLLVQITCTLHWFNPLVWIAAWRIRVERERACDDVVLNNGMKPSDYAEHLLGIATGYVGRQFAGLSAVAMARKARLEGRLLSMLDGKLSRRELSLGAVTFSFLVTVAIVFPVAMMQAADDAKDNSQSQQAPDAETPREQLRSPALSDGRNAQSVYQSWLLKLAVRSGWRGVRVEPSSDRKHRDTDRRFGFSVDGRATVGELASFLNDFYSAGHQHEIRQMWVKPIEGSRELVSITAEVLCLPDGDKPDDASTGVVPWTDRLEDVLGSSLRKVPARAKRRTTRKSASHSPKNKLDLSALLESDKRDPGTARRALMQLPGMTEAIADAILDWLDEDDESREFGAEADYYQSLTDPGTPRNGPIESLEELLMVRDVSEALLSGLSSGRLSEAKPQATKLVYGSDQTLKPRIVQGRVLTPNGKPVGGARIYVWRWNWVLNHDTCQVKTLTNEDGRFEFLFVVPSDEAQAFVVCAIADGFGAAIGYAAPHLPDGDVVHAMYGVKQDGSEQPKGTLLLSKEDTPITGRVVDVEGRPVRHATVRVSGMSEGYNVDLTDWLNHTKGISSDKPSMHFFAVPKVKEFSAATDDEGNFQLCGIGPERVIQLLIAGESIECRGVYAVTRKEPSFSAPRHPDGVKAVVDFTYHGPTFVHTAGPTTPVVGIVRDADTDWPLPGARVRPARLAGIPIDNPLRYGYVEAVTDEHGRYRLVGLPRGVNLIQAVAAHVPDLDVHKVRATLTADTSSGGDKPLQADVLYLKPSYRSHP